MKKHEIITSKHVDHIENEKIILSQLEHPFTVSYSLFHILLTVYLCALSWNMMDFSKMNDIFILLQNCWVVVISSLTIEMSVNLTQTIQRK